VGAAAFAEFVQKNKKDFIFFQLEVALKDADDAEVASTSIVEPMGWKLEFTMHIRDEELKNPYTLEAKLYYPDGPAQEPVTFSFDVKPPQPDPG
jgi:hypothetical protein